MSRIFIEGQYDPARREQLLQAMSEFGGQPYRVTVRDVDADGGYAALADFVRLYRHCGATVVVEGREHLLTLPPTLSEERVS